MLDNKVNDSGDIFHNIGDTIKKIANTLFYLNVIVFFFGLFYGLYALFNGFGMALIIVLIAGYSSILSTFFMYALGELVCTCQAIRKNTEKLIEKADITT